MSLRETEPVTSGAARKESVGEKENVVASTYTAAQKKGRRPAIGATPPSRGAPRRFQKEVVGRRAGASVTMACLSARRRGGRRRSGPPRGRARARGRARRRPR